MLKKLWVDIKSKKPSILFDKSENLEYYYIKFEPKPKNLNRLISTFDSNGVPINSSYIDVQKPKLHYYPISIGQYALAIFHSWLQTKDVEKKNHFLRIADWFVVNAVQDNNLGVYWLTDVDKPEFNVFDPWKSAFTQSRGLSVLLRAFQITKNKSYYELATKALVPFQISISKGGVRSGNENDTIYEEYVASKPTRILDGAMFSLFGLYDAVRATKEINESDHDIAKQLFDAGINGLIHWLPKFDMGYWVYYNRCEIEDYPQNDPCTIGYLRLVCAQLTILHELTGREELKQYSQQFSSYLSPLNILKMYFEKYKALKKLNRL